MSTRVREAALVCAFTERIAEKVPLAVFPQSPFERPWSEARIEGGNASAVSSRSRGSSCIESRPKHFRSTDRSDTTRLSWRGIFALMRVAFTQCGKSHGHEKLMFTVYLFFPILPSEKTPSRDEYELPLNGESCLKGYNIKTIIKKKVNRIITFIKNMCS